MEFEFSVVEKAKALRLRERFISAFIDTSHEMFHEHIEVLHSYPDGEFYRGYLWCFLEDNGEYEHECTMETACECLKKHNNIYVMWDLFSNHRIKNSCKFVNGYEKSTVIETSGALVAEMIPDEWGEIYDPSRCWFPDDIYCFDESMNWYVVFTHEGWDSYTNPELKEDDYIRICFVRE